MRPDLADVTPMGHSSLRIVRCSEVRPRPAVLRSLGLDDPPEEVDIGGRPYHRVEIYKHDSWAATALYRGPGGLIVCKFNRVQPVLGVPMAWLGRRLARREACALQRLDDVRGIPAECGPIIVDGRRAENAVGHAYIAGHPLKRHERPGPEFFQTLEALLQTVHERHIAYVDLHKVENVIVGDDGSPHLIDFQICFALWSSNPVSRFLLRPLLRTLQQTDRYHLAKHVRRQCPEPLDVLPFVGHAQRPWWIKAHRLVAVPLRKLRRGLLAAIGVRSADGMATSELFAEDAVRRELNRAA